MLIAFFQIIAASFMWLILKIFTKFEVHGAQNLKELQKPFILVSNHESMLDPVLGGIVILHRPSLFPLRFMSKDWFLYIPLAGQLLWILGAFRARKKKGIGRSLLAPVKILEKGQGLMMFPEAHIIPERPKLGEGRRGAAILALTARAPIMPISVHTPRNFTFFRFLFTRPQVTVRIGEPFYLNNTDYMDFSDDNMKAATAEIMKKIANLYYKHEY